MLLKLFHYTANEKDFVGIQCLLMMTALYNQTCEDSYIACSTWMCREAVPQAPYHTGMVECPIWPHLPQYKSLQNLLFTSWHFMIKTRKGKDKIYCMFHRIWNIWLRKHHCRGKNSCGLITTFIKKVVWRRCWKYGLT